MSSVTDYYDELSEIIKAEAINGCYDTYNSFISKNQYTIDHHFLFMFLHDDPSLPFDFQIRLIMDHKGSLTNSRNVAGNKTQLNLSEKVKDHLVFNTDIVESQLDNIESMRKLMISDDDGSEEKENLRRHLSSPNNPAAHARNVYLKLTIV